MTTVAFDTTPFSSGHKGRGVGVYARNLLEELVEFEDLNLIKPEAKQKPDLVHYPFFDLFFRTLPLRKKAPTVVTVHDVIPLVLSQHFPVGIRGKINFKIQAKSLKSVDHIITDSQASKKDINKFLEIPLQKISVIPLAADREISKPSKTVISEAIKKHKLPERFFLYVGDINYNKNVPGLIRSISESNTLPLVIITRANLKQNIPEANAIRTEIDKAPSNLIKTIKVDGSQELSALYASCSWYVQPSYYEGFGLPLLEAMTYGAPTISSNTSSLPEVGGDAPLYFDPNKPEDLTKTLTAAAGHTTKQTQQLIEKSKAQAKKFSWQETARQTIKIYQQLSKKNPSA